MARVILTNTRLFVNGFDLTSNSNKVELECEAEEADTTNFGSGGWKESLQGLIDTTLSGEGQWEAGDATKVDNGLWGAFNGGSTGPWTLCPVGASDGALAYLTKAVVTGYALGGEVGETMPWTAEAKGSWPVVRGVVGHPPGTARTASGSGTGYQLGAVSATQYLYASLHVLSIAGTSTPTITVVIESDSDNTFASPTTRITFSNVTSVTGVSGEISRTAGAITDQWFRATWTISGTTPSFLFLVAFEVR